MTHDVPSISSPASTNVHTADEVAAILRERGWLSPSPSLDAESSLQAWLSRAAELLGPHVTDRAALDSLLALVFTYDAADSLQGAESQAVLSREGARDVIRELANRILGGADINSDRFKEIIEALKMVLPYRSRAMFHPIRLALTGRAGEGELDRVILLLDDAARIEFVMPVKGNRQRMLEFCAALD